MEVKDTFPNLPGDEESEPGTAITPVEASMARIPDLPQEIGCHEEGPESVSF